MCNTPPVSTVTCTPVLNPFLSPPYEATYFREDTPFTEMTTPIDAVAVPHLVPFLRTHGATVEAVGANQKYRARSPTGKWRIRTFRTYHITFPEGMRQRNGLVTSALLPFLLLFPDGAHLQGRLNTIRSPGEIILGFPEETPPTREQP